MSETAQAANQSLQTGLTTAAITSNPWAIGIAAGASLLSGLLGARARKEEEERRRKYEGQMMGLQTQAQAAQQHSQNEQQAFSNMVNQYTNAIRG